MLVYGFVGFFVRAECMHAFVSISAHDCVCAWLNVCVHRSEWKGETTTDEGSVETRRTGDRRQSAAQRGENLVSTHLKYKSSLFIRHVWVKSFMFDSFLDPKKDKFLFMPFSSVLCFTPQHTIFFFSLAPDKNIHICDDLFPGPGSARTWSGPLVMDHLELVLICTGHGALRPVPLQRTKAQQLRAEQWRDQQCADSCPDPQAQLLLSTSMYK